MAYVACVLGCLLALSQEYDQARRLVEESRSLQEQVRDETYMPFTHNVWAAFYRVKTTRRARPIYSKQA
jgi:hypothetical protein